MKPQRILVTGLGGFLGRHIQWVASQEAKFNEVELVDWRTVGADLTISSDHRQSLVSGRFDGVLHLAWLSTSSIRYEYDPENFRWAEATVALASACSDAGVWFLGTGSGLEHDVTAESTPYLEAKRRAFFEISHQLDGSAFSWLRPFWIVSIPDGRPRVLLQALLAKSQGTPFGLREPDHLLDFIEVRDVVSGILTVIRSGVRGAQDIGSGELRSVSDMVAVALGTAPTGTSSLDCERTPYAIADIDRLTTLGWRPTNTFALFRDGARG